MNLPLILNLDINSHEGNLSRQITLENAFSVILGANGSGKTHLLKSFKHAFPSEQIAHKKVRFVSAGRMGMFEQYRSNCDGYNHGDNYYNKATHGSKDYSSRRHQIETINGDFHTLSARLDILIKVRERLRKLFKRDVVIDWNNGNLHVYFSRLTSSSSQYSSAREASGLIHLTALLSALYDDEVGVLLIDEPEVSLHPQLQAFLLKEILSVAGVPSAGSNKKIVVIATHSTEMLRINQIEDLSSLIFCYDLKQQPIQISKKDEVLKNQKLKSLIKRLGQEHKLSLFSQKPLLVEGPSDVIICNALADQLGLYLEASGSQILPVNGKAEFPATVKLLRLMGKQPVVLADADMFVDDLNLIKGFYGDKNVRETADLLASEKGINNINAFSKSVRDDFIQLVDKTWGKIKDTFKSKNQEADTDVDAQKYRISFSALFTGQLKDDEWTKILNRINSLFEIFEQTGLFILRKGAIESYYSDQNATNKIERDKIESSILQSEAIYEADSDSLRHQYGDIVRCLEYASNGEQIKEEEILREIALSIIAPIHADFADGKTDFDLNVRAQNINKQNASIFDFSIEEDKLKVSITSPILNIKDFPILLSKTDDVRVKINQALGLA
ncbi:ATP-dependent nuclease [Bergeriella denitrificans]|uniref:Predicted ATPase n=1 Tax=Bergeriella denitrificans TaxID=494 RepID=A0A378UGT6_BERDE|nr:AAA family ATPase [Bergeriella denitrificans]STZ76536.1 Predicted ATPase [Bergeriella denitrificans]